MKAITFFLVLLFSCQLYGQSFPVSQLRADFDTLRHALEEAHGGLYRYHSKSTINYIFDRYRKKLDSPMGYVEFYALLSRLLAEIRDGHMRVDYDEKVAASLPKPLFFPFRILMDRNKAIILSNDTKNNSSIQPGMELVSINGRRLKRLKKNLLPYMRSDAFNHTGREAGFERNFNQHYWAFVDTTSVFVMKVKDSSGKVFKETINGVLNTDRESNRNNNAVNAAVLALTKPVEGLPDNLSLRFINDRVAALRIRYFVGPRFNIEIDSLFNIISQRHPESLIIDIRGNGGGLDQWSAHLISKLVTKPFRYLDRIHARVLIPSFAEWKQKPPVDLDKGTKPDPNGGYLLLPMLNGTLNEQLPDRNPFTGKVIVLIDGKTFSAACDFSSVLGTVSDAVFVGKTPGGGYNGNTSGLNAILKLPHTRFNINIHLWDYWTAVPGTLGKGMKPDYDIERKPADWLKGIDTQWEFALKLCMQ